MTPQEIACRLTAIHTALVEKTGEQPFVEPHIRLGQDAKWVIELHKSYGDGARSYVVGVARSDSIPGAIDHAERLIDALPDPHETAKRGWQKKLGAVIDEGNDLNLPTEVMAPLGAASQAMSKNLIAQEAAE